LLRCLVGGSFTMIRSWRGVAYTAK
jgi:hypothetical protein